MITADSLSNDSSSSHLQQRQGKDLALYYPTHNTEESASTNTTSQYSGDERSLSISDKASSQNDQPDKCDDKRLNDTTSTSNVADQYLRTVDIEMVECLLLLKLCDVALRLPIDSRSLLRTICKVRGFERTILDTVENLLEKFAHQELITIEEPTAAMMSRVNKQTNVSKRDDELCIYVISADHTKLIEFNRAFGSNTIKALLLDDSHNEDDVEAGHVSNSSAASRDNNSYANRLLEPYINKDSADEQVGLRMDKSKTGLRKLSGCDISKKQPQGDDVESLLSLSSTREKESKKIGEELLELLSKPTAKERNLLERFRSADGYQVQEFCPKGTKDECRRNSKGTKACDKLHFKKIIAKHTEESLGDCSFLNTCFHMDSCKYVHYEVDYDDAQQQFVQVKKSQMHPGNMLKNNRKSMLVAVSSTNNPDQAKTLNTAEKISPSTSKQGNSRCNSKLASQQEKPVKPISKYALSPEEQARIDIRNRKRFKTVLYPPQWIQCDLRYFDMSLLGKFSVVMADPPWDIHMELPYGTMSDDEMRKLNVPALQDDGVIFLWVTGRAMELGRECLALWGYERCDEIIWVKTNQLQRIIRTGRTGHWLNHGKEHCLVGIKGNPTEMNRGLDCDIIVAEVRATSHKPDEIYGIIERLSPGTRKIELFGRAHNVQPNWITLGNQLDGVRLVEPSLISAFEGVNLPYQTE